MVSKFLITAVILTLILSGNLRAQNKIQAFEEIDAVFSIQQNTNRNLFHDFWSPNSAFQLDLDTPFYFGHFFLGGRLTSFSGIDPDLPDIDNIQANVGWGLRYEIIEGLKAGGNLGVLFSMMSFQNVSPEQQERAQLRFGSTSPESEGGIFFGGDLSYQFTEKWGIRLFWSRNLVYTKRKMKLNYGGVGVYRKIETPDWLERVLR